MQFSLASEIFGLPWHLSVQGLQQYMPLVNGMLAGAMFDEENEPKENIPFGISAATSKPVAWSVAESDESEDESEGDHSTYEKVIHVLPVRGVLMKNDMACGPAGARTLGKRLKDADSDESVIGHVMIIEGPGGSAAAVPELTDVMKSCQKPIVVWVDGMMASAHMYVGAYAAERIASRETDLIGCIGTMIVYSGRISKSDEDFMKERQVTIYADEAYEKNEEYEKAINEFDFKPAKDRVLNPHNEQFINDMKALLPGVEDQHLHGRTFQASEVVGSLVDSIGSFDDAVNRVIELSRFTTSQQQQNINQQQNTMNYEKIQAVLGLTSMEVESDGRRTFTIEEMQVIDAALNSSHSTEIEQQLSALQSENETLTATITGHEATISELNEQITVLQNAAGAVDPKLNSQTDAANTVSNPNVLSKETIDLYKQLKQ